MKTVRMFEPDEFQILRQDIAELKRMIESIKPSLPDRRLNFKEAAAYLNMHRATLASKFKSGDYPTSLIHVVGKDKTTRYLLESELEAFKKSKWKQ